MAALNQPKWRKFLSLKGEPKVKNIEIPSTENSKVKDKNASSHSNGTSQSMPSPPTKKRQRTEEEIAARKAKKLKSKGKEGQEWQKLTEDREKQLSASENQDGTIPATDEESKVPNANETTPAKITEPSTDELLSKKAREISKARRKEKLQEKQQQSPKKEKVKVDQNLDRKSKQVEEYLDAYGKHVDSGSEWKFKKQYQIWILKHLYDYQWKSDELLIRYLKTVQGGARERLVTDAKEVIKSAEGTEDTKDVNLERAEKVVKALVA